MDINLQNIETLLAEKKYDEVRAIINATAAAKMTDKEKGAALTGLASAYVEISNAINTRYLQALEDAIDGIKMINAAESKAGENIKIAEVRGKLGM